MPFFSPSYLRTHPELKRTHLSLGWHPTTRDELLLPPVDRYSALYVLGVPGMGKSGFLETLIHQDAEAGNAIVVVDPHGDLIDHVLAALPQHRLAQTFRLDMTDERFPFGLNPFRSFQAETEVERSQAAAKIEHLFTVLFEGALDQQFLPRFVRAVTFTFLDNPGATLVDVLTLLTDHAFRAKLLANVKDPTVRQFWDTQYPEHMSEAERTRRVGPLVGRLERLFMGKALVRNIVGQRRTSVNFRRAIEERQILLVPLPIKQLGDDARVVGLLLIAQLHAAVFSFANVPEHARPGVSIYIDEFQNFTTADIEELVTEGRKYGVRLTVAHQIRSKLPEFLLEPTVAMRTKVCFQTTEKDARAMAPFFPLGEGSIAPEDLEPHATKHLAAYGCEDPTVRTFIERYLRPMQLEGKRVEIVSERAVTFLESLVPGSMEQEKAPTYEENPTIYLDPLFYEVMRTRNGLLPIPPGAVVGFANCMGGFYRATRWSLAHAFSGNQLLTAEASFPTYLATHTARGWVWLRPPESPEERLLHCIFHLRATMLYLAEHPIGKVSKTTSAESAQALLSLPKRAAWVRHGDGVGVIYTHHTPRPAPGAAERAYFVREQTRQRYCHPREQIEDRVLTTDPATFSRWEALTTEATAEAGGDVHVTDATDVRRAAAGDTASPSGPLSAATGDGAAIDGAALQPGVAENDQGAAEDPYQLWVRAIRRDPEP